jgi:hypothetical protein
MEITDSELKKKLDEKSIRGVSGGILFDYQRTEDAKKFDQVLSHVMVTNSPWINGTGDFTDKLPEGVMADEPRWQREGSPPVGEVEFVSRETDPQPQLPARPDGRSSGGSAARPGKVLWKPEQGFRFAQDSVQRALVDWRNSLMASMPEAQRYTLDWPYFRVDDVQMGDRRQRAHLLRLRIRVRHLGRQLQGRQRQQRRDRPLRAVDAGQAGVGRRVRAGTYVSRRSGWSTSRAQART